MERSSSRQFAMKVHRSTFRIGKKCFESGMWIKLPFFKVVVFGKEVEEPPVRTEDQRQRILDLMNMERGHRIPIVEPAREEPWIVRFIGKFIPHSWRGW